MNPLRRWGKKGRVTSFTLAFGSPNAICFCSLARIAPSSKGLPAPLGDNARQTVILP